MAPFSPMNSPEILPLENIDGISPVIQLTPKTGRLNPDYLEALLNKALKNPANLTPAESELLEQLAKIKC